MIDAVDPGGVPAWQPPNVSIAAGDTVRWEFDQAGDHPHDHLVQRELVGRRDAGARRPPWSTPSPRPAPTRSCASSTARMTGTVTVESDPLEKVLVFSETAGFRHDSIPAGIAAIQELGAANDFAVDATEDSTQFNDANLAQYDAVIWLSTTGDVLTDEQQAAFERYIRAGNGYVGIHAAADTEYGWAWYGDLARRLLRLHPAGTPTASVDIEDADDPSTARLPTRWTADGRVVQLQASGRPGRRGGGADYSPRDRRPRAGHGRRVDLRRGRRQTPPTTTTRSRGARTSTAATPGTRAWATRSARSASPSSASTCSAASGPRPARPRPTAARARGRRPARPTSRRSRSTTTPRTRWSSTSPPTGASSTSSATAA